MKLIQKHRHTINTGIINKKQKHNALQNIYLPQYCKDICIGPQSSRQDKNTTDWRCVDFSHIWIQEHRWLTNQHVPVDQQLTQYYMQSTCTIWTCSQRIVCTVNQPFSCVKCRIQCIVFEYTQLRTPTPLCKPHCKSHCTITCWAFLSASVQCTTRFSYVRNLHDLRAFYT